MSQGYIGYDLQNALREELLDRGIKKGVDMLLTQVEVDPDDPAFKHPTKPIGAFMTKEEADHLVETRGYDVIEDSGRGYRRVVASPKPVSIVEIDTIRTLVDAGQVVIACGGGGIPVYRTEGNHLKGAAAVIDKDLAAECLAEALDADLLIILTAVENVSIHFNKPDQKDLREITTEEARRYMEAGEFAPGSMLPKVEASVKFAESGEGREALITLLEKAKDGIEGNTGTIIRK
jgi:carbamate kinase